MTRRVPGICRGHVPKLILVMVACFILSIFLLNFYISSNSSPLLTYEISLDSINRLNDPDELLKHVQDLGRLQKSVLSELSKLEQKRNLLKTHIESLENQNKDLNSKLRHFDQTIHQIQVDIQEMEYERAESMTFYHSLLPPLNIIETLHNTKQTVEPITTSESQCNLNRCFDYVACSVLSGCPVYIFSQTNIRGGFSEAFKTSFPNQRAVDYLTSCFSLSIITTMNDLDILYTNDVWRTDGRNNIIIDKTQNHLLASHQSKAMIASSLFKARKFRDGFDIYLPYVEGNVTWQDLPLMLPTLRNNLLVFYCRVKHEGESKFITTLKQSNSQDDRVEIVTDCSAPAACTSQFCLCGDFNTHLSRATFTLIISPSDSALDSELCRQLYHALKLGSIPVILGENVKLPMDEIIPWRDAVLVYAYSRITEMTFILRNILEGDIVTLKRSGRLIFESFLSSEVVLARGVLALMRTRLGIPPQTYSVPESKPVYNQSNPMQMFETRLESGELLGPLEDPAPSQVYYRNYTQLRLNNHNQIHSSLYLMPSTPWNPELPTDAKFHGSSFGFRPINAGMGGSGREFSLSLGGNQPHEQFTIVFLTYNRLEILIKILTQLKGLPYLNKVIIVWNNPILPPPEARWPKLDAPIVVVRGVGNSLNNRFYPYNEIETEAVLSLDDDMYLQQNEIIFAFRVWRESRDRIVGFPGRYHAWNPQDLRFNYNSNHSCELSMILTGAAFVHKYYLYQYTFAMSQSIRDKVDEYMNCEDLAMNFLVSHITQKPPIKTTSRWTFRCPDCEESLWSDESHFNERHECINYFIKVYGYLPLKFTQYRADSVLFKTKVPADKQKCFTVV